MVNAYSMLTAFFQHTLFDIQFSDTKTTCYQTKALDLLTPFCYTCPT